MISIDLNTKKKKKKKKRRGDKAKRSSRVSLVATLDDDDDDDKSNVRGKKRLREQISDNAEAVQALLGEATALAQAQTEVEQLHWQEQEKEQEKEKAKERETMQCVVEQKEQLDVRRKSRYASQLMARAAERRIEEQQVAERRLQLQVEEDRRIHGETESFVTDAYKQHLERLSRWKSDGSSHSSPSSSNSTIDCDRSELIVVVETAQKGSDDEGEHGDAASSVVESAQVRAKNIADARERYFERRKKRDLRAFQ
jgi:Nuclear speckle splicing regulatory protein 1, N-terminal